MRKKKPLTKKPTKKNTEKIGTIKLWDINLPKNPLMSYEEHTHEVYSVDWNLISKDLFVSGSWDNSIKVKFFNLFLFFVGF